MPPQFQDSQIRPTNVAENISTPKPRSHAFLVVLTILMLISGAYAIWYSFNLPPEPEPENFSITKTDEFADWKTYRNEEYGFEFKYPKEWAPVNFGDGTYFKNLDISVLQINYIEQKGKDRVMSDTCPANYTIDTDFGIIYVVYCSYFSEIYIYFEDLPENKILQFSYHDNFENNWAVEKKIHIFKQIISTFKISRR